MQVRTDQAWKRLITELGAVLGDGQFTRAEVSGLLTVFLAEALREGDQLQREQALAEIVTLVRQLWEEADSREAKDV